MLPLELAFFLVMLELTVGSFASLAWLDMRRDTSRGFIVFQGWLYLIFAVLTLLAMNAFATPQLVRGHGLDDTWVRAQGPVVLLFALLMIPWNVLLWRDRPVAGARSGQRATTSASPLERARFAVGWLTTLVGLAALFVDGMAYRPLADSRLGGAFVVGLFVCGGLALGGVMTAMLLGHWYLNTPTASGKPLEFATVLMLAALVLELIFTLLIGNSTARPTQPTHALAPGTTIVLQGGQFVIVTPTPAPAPTARTGSTSSKTAGKTSSSTTATATPARITPITTGAMWWLELVMGLLSPLALGGVALYLTRGRSFQSATGMLYLCLAFIFIGEILGCGLLVTPAV
jgi:hypothetical protein